MSTLELLIQAQLSCAAPGDVLVVCRRAPNGCRRPSPCDGCARVRVSRSTTAREILGEIGSSAQRHA
jgi:hypothetical protein